MAQAKEYRAKMIEAAAEGDEALTEKYLDGKALTDDEIKRGLQGARAEERDRAVHVRHARSRTRACRRCSTP